MRVLLALATLAGALAAQAPRDNILLLIADDFGVDNVGVYGEGGDLPPTPNIDALAANGVLFRNAWANSQCSPTRACVFTGRYGFRTLVGAVPTRRGGVLQPEEITLPEALDRANTGYAHALIGKWHLGTTFGGFAAPNVAGFSHFAGHTGGTIRYFNWPRSVNGAVATSRRYSTTQLVDDALSWIGQQTSPWLCVVAFNAPHSPIHRPPESLHSQDLLGKTIAKDPRACSSERWSRPWTARSAVCSALSARLANEPT